MRQNPESGLADIVHKVLDFTPQGHHAEIAVNGAYLLKGLALKLLVTLLQNFYRSRVIDQQDSIRRAAVLDLKKPTLRKRPFQFEINMVVPHGATPDYTQDLRRTRTGTAMND